MNLLELFSGTHSIGKVAEKKGYKVYSVDRDLDDKDPFGSKYKSFKHFKEDILTWNYKQYQPHFFKIITASPVCLWWSNLRNCWIGRKLNGKIVTKESLLEDINTFGKPMVDKVREIIDYFKPEFYWIENPQTGKMKKYITDLPFFDVDYCKYTDWGYKKRTRFWTNIKDFKPKTCYQDCINIITYSTGQKKHRNNLAANNQKKVGDVIINCNTKKLREKYKDVKPMKNCGTCGTKLDRYRIPPIIIEELLQCCQKKKVIQ